MQTDAAQQGLVQGMITGMRGLCNGLGPAMYGLIFSLFHVDLNEPETDAEDAVNPGGISNIFSTVGGSSHRAPPILNVHNSSQHPSNGNNFGTNYPPIDFASITSLVPGPPFVFGAFLVMLALMVAAFIPEDERVRCGGDSCSGGGSSFKGTNLRRPPSIKGATGRKKKSDDSDTDDPDGLLDQIKHQRDLNSDKDDSMKDDDDYDYMTTVPLMEGVKDRNLL